MLLLIRTRWCCLAIWIRGFRARYSTVAALRTREARFAFIVWSLHVAATWNTLPSEMGHAKDKKQLKRHARGKQFHLHARRRILATHNENHIACGGKDIRKGLVDEKAVANLKVTHALADVIPMSELMTPGNLALLDAPNQRQLQLTDSAAPAVEEQLAVIPKGALVGADRASHSRRGLSVLFSMYNSALAGARALSANPLEEHEV